MSDAYKRAGVDIAAGNEAVERIKGYAHKTFRPEVLAGLGGFGSSFALDTSQYREPVLVSGSDGVGTKLKLAVAMDRHDTIGVDAVAMCVNDIVTQGAEPLFFLDYLACGKLEPAKISAIVKGIADGCVQAGCALIGGETAEMPGMYPPEEYDIAGFAVGVVERAQLIDGSSIRPGDALIGLASSGLHSNGYSLVRTLLFEDHTYRLTDTIESLGVSLGEELLRPTRIYVTTILKLLERHTLKGIAHITGGGLLGNIPRILPQGVTVRLEPNSWPVPPIFELLRRTGTLAERDMLTTFNMGIGMVLIVDGASADPIIHDAQTLGERAYRIGQVSAGDGRVTLAP